MTRSITILGATGSVGCSTLDLVRRNRDDWQVEALTANCNVAELAALAREFGASLAVVADERCLPDLRKALAGTGTPVVLVLVTGRPYAIGPVADRLAAAVQAFFPGEEGGTAIASVLSGRVVPSGRLPVEMPRLAGAQPSSYLRSRLASRHPASSIDPTPLFAFGHGLSYTDFTLSGLKATVRDGIVTASFTVANTGKRAGKEVAQVYVAPVGARWEAPKRLGGFAKVDVRPGAAAQASVTVDPRLLAVYDAPTKRWNVAAGEYRVILAASAADDKAQETTVRLEAASYDVHGKPLRTRAAP